MTTPSARSSSTVADLALTAPRIDRTLQPRAGDRHGDLVDLVDRHPRIVGRPVVPLAFGNKRGDPLRRHGHARGSDALGGHLRRDLVDSDATRHVHDQDVSAAMHEGLHLDEDRRVRQLVDAVSRRVHIERMADERVRTSDPVGDADHDSPTARVGEAGHGIGKVFQRVLDGSALLRLEVERLRLCTVRRATGVDRVQHGQELDAIHRFSSLLRCPVMPGERKTCHKGGPLRAGGEHLRRRSVLAAPARGGTTAASRTTRSPSGASSSTTNGVGGFDGQL